MQKQSKIDTSGNWPHLIDPCVTVDRDASTITIDGRAYRILNQSILDAKGRIVGRLFPSGWTEKHFVGARTMDQQMYRLAVVSLIGYRWKKEQNT